MSGMRECAEPVRRHEAERAKYARRERWFDRFMREAVPGALALLPSTVL
jgi:hypothetical protein